MLTIAIVSVWLHAGASQPPRSELVHFHRDGDASVQQARSSSASGPIRRLLQMAAGARSTLAPTAAVGRQLMQSTPTQDYASYYTDPSSTYSAQPEMAASAELSSKMQQPYAPMYSQYVPAAAQTVAAPQSPPPHRTRMGRHERIRPDYPDYPKHVVPPTWANASLPIEERSVHGGSASSKRELDRR